MEGPVSTYVFNAGSLCVSRLRGLEVPVCVTFRKGWNRRDIYDMSKVLVMASIALAITDEFNLGLGLVLGQGRR